MDIGDTICDSAKIKSESGGDMSAGTVPATDAALVPNEAVRWLTLYCSSNAELATLSNVSKRWRDIASKALQDDIIQKYCEHLVGNADRKEIRAALAGIYPAAALLLPDMAMEVLARRKPSLMQQTQTGISEIDCNEDGQFCLAWFAPKGIEKVSVRVKDEEDEDSSSSSSSESEGAPSTDANKLQTIPFVPSGQEGYALSDTEEVKSSHHHRRHRGAGDIGSIGQSTDHYGNGPLSRAAASPKRREVHITENTTFSRKKKDVNEARLQTCVCSWWGYRSAMDVLLPFGFATSFVRDLLDSTMDISCSYWNLNATDDLQGPFNNLMKPNANVVAQTTFAVRGTTLARPDGYCLRWEKEEAELEEVLKKDDFGPGQDAAVQQNSTVIDDEQRRRIEYRWKRNRMLLRQKGKERKRIMRERLPRMAMSTRNKNLHLSAEEEIAKGGKRQRCVQFLNSSGTNAVRLRTPEFACGPVRSPVTMFCVGIATEDGCFVSGLRRRFELGHLYPGNSRDSLIDMSPVCLAVDPESKPKPTLEADLTGMKKSRSAAFLLDSSSAYSSKPSSLADSDSSSDISGDSHSLNYRCTCPFCITMNPVVNEDDNSEAYENVVFRGLLGPGRWHLYVAVFDGEDSLIRIDGVEEPKICCDSAEASAPPVLDGLTIGSDHGFDMSLCYGGGDDGEGDGAIAELAVFKGHLSSADIQRMEEYLMKKHGIGIEREVQGGEGKTISIDRWQEDEWRRQAAALIAQPPPFRLQGDPVPLRVAANYRTVAWQRSSAVTGKVLQVSRIGCKYGNGSSDW